jgi:hypothetical protein
MTRSGQPGYRDDDEDTVLTIAPGHLLGNDTDGRQRLSIASVQGAVGGTQ